MTKRITTRLEKNKIKITTELGWAVFSPTAMTDELIFPAIEKLARYEDLEEQGKLSILPQTGWIPVSERLPKEDCMCLITAKVFDKLEIQYVFYQKELDLFICNGKPMAWQPLPPAYKEREEG